jgi:cytochrome c-type biogenesis protein
MQLNGNIFDYFIAFGAGVVVSFTPCIYPVIPMTASFIARANIQGTRIRGFILSLVYVLGLAVVYCGLAVFAALTGKVFGVLQNSPLVLFLAANILIFFALVMVDAVPLPFFAVSVSPKYGKASFWAVFLAGMISGVVVGPCTTPVLGTLLLFVASRQNVLYGASLLFVFSYGVGFSLILVGTFSGILSRLPKSGSWLVWVKQCCAVILLLMAGYLFLLAGQRL